MSDARNAYVWTPGPDVLLGGSATIVGLATKFNLSNVCDGAQRAIRIFGYSATHVHPATDLPISIDGAASSSIHLGQNASQTDGFDVFIDMSMHTISEGLLEPGWTLAGYSPDPVADSRTIDLRSAGCGVQTAGSSPPTIAKESTNPHNWFVCLKHSYSAPALLSLEKLSAGPSSYVITIRNRGGATSPSAISVSDVFTPSSTGQTITGVQATGFLSGGSCLISGTSLGVTCSLGLAAGSSTAPTIGTITVAMSSYTNTTCASQTVSNSVGATFGGREVDMEAGATAIATNVFPGSTTDACAPTTYPTVAMAAAGSDVAAGKAYWDVAISNKGSNPKDQSDLVVIGGHTDAQFERGSSSAGCAAGTSAGQFSCHVLAGQDVTFRVSRSLSLLADRCVGGQLPNSLASARAADGTDLNPDMAPVSVSVPGVEDVSCLTISKTATWNGKANDYTIAITNTGPETAVVVRDVFDAAGTGARLVGSVGTTGVFNGACDTATLQGLGCALAVPNGGATILVSSSAVTNAACQPVSVSNTATATWKTGDGPGIGIGTQGNVVAREYAGAPCAPGLTIAKNGPASVELGGEVGYSVTVGNGGSAATSGAITVTDEAPASLVGLTAGGSGWSCAVSTANVVECATSAAIGAGGSLPAITISGTAPGDRCETLRNVATVSGGGDAAAHRSDPAVETAVVGCEPRLTIDVHPSAPEVTAGTGFEYTIVVGNSGTAPASAVHVNQLLSGDGVGALGSVSGACSGLPCTVASIAPGGSATITVNVVTDASACGVVGNAATASIEGATTTVTDDTGNAVMVVGCVAHLTLKTVLDNTNGDASPPATGASFTPAVDGVLVDWDARTEVSPGEHTLRQTTPAGWTAGAWSCPGATLNGTAVTLAAAQDITCTITNASQPAHVVVNATYILRGGSKRAPSVTIDGLVAGAPATGDATHDVWSSVQAKAGEVVVDETLVSADWSQVSVLVSAECGATSSAGTSITVHPAPGATCSVTFTNERRTGSVVVHTQKTST